jgi:DNA repair exonuclease SbcCD nuclease subunit
MVASSLTKGDEGQYLPSSIESIRALGYQYFGLGHVHSGGPIDKDETIHYSGVLQGLNRNETGFKGGNLVTINDEGIKVRKVVMCEMIYDNLSLDISDITTIDRLYDELAMVLMPLDKKEKLSVSLTLTGRSVLHRKLKEAVERENLSTMLLEKYDFFNIIIKSDVKSKHKAEAYKNKKSVLGAILNQIERVKASGQVPDLAYLSKGSHHTVEDLMTTMEDDILDLFLEDSDEN